MKNKTFEVYDDYSGKTLLIEAISLEEALSISETLDFDKFEDGDEVDLDNYPNKK